MKQALRKRAKLLAQGLDDEWRRAASADVVSQLEGLLRSWDYRSIGLYRAMADEVDLSDIFAPLATEGKDLYLPRVMDAEQIAFYRYIVGDDLERVGSYKLEEPRTTAEQAVDALDVLLVPAVHYYQNYRLGRGKGYYDRYIAAYPPKHLVGLSLGLLGDAPFAPEAWDKPMHICLSPRI